MLYEQIEQELTELLGCEDVLLLPTITLIHLSVIPVLAAGGTVFVDRRAHKTIHEGAQFTLHDSWNELKRYANLKPENVRELLREARLRERPAHRRRRRDDQQDGAGERNRLDQRREERAPFEAAIDQHAGEGDRRNGDQAKQSAIGIIRRRPWCGAALCPSARTTRDPWASRDTSQRSAAPCAEKFAT